MVIRGPNMKICMSSGGTWIYSVNSVFCHVQQISVHRLVVARSFTKIPVAVS